MSQNNSSLYQIRALSDIKVQSIVTNAGVLIIIYADDLVVLSWRVIPTQRHYNGTRSVESQRCARTSSLQCDSEQWICASSQWGHDLLLEVPCYNHIDFPGDWTIKTLYEDDKEDAKEGAVYDRIGRFSLDGMPRNDDLAETRVARTSDWCPWNFPTEQRRRDGGE